MTPIKVLFLCIHNSARSQMAEAFLKEYGGERYQVESAGLEAGKLNPLAVEAMNEVGIDIARNKTKNVFDFQKQGRTYDYVITVCDEASAARCPVFAGRHIKLNWGFPDPSQFSGTAEERLEQTRQVRDQIKEAVSRFISDTSIKE